MCPHAVCTFVPARYNSMEYSGFHIYVSRPSKMNTHDKSNFKVFISKHGEGPNTKVSLFGKYLVMEHGARKCSMVILTVTQNSYKSAKTVSIPSAYS